MHKFILLMIVMGGQVAKEALVAMEFLEALVDQVVMEVQVEMAKFLALEVMEEMVEKVVQYDINN